jgi:glycosyltransferase involved in cell wall biosynthesis
VRVIVVDASGMPDHWSGARTRLRGWVQAWAQDRLLPRLALRVARGGRLLDGLSLGAVEVVESAPAGGPLLRGFRHLVGGDEPPALLKQARVWHSETLPAFAPSGVPASVTIHDLRWAEPRAATGAAWSRWLPRHLASRTWLPRIARRLAAIVTVSPASADSIERHLGVARSRVRCVENANVGVAAAELEAESAAALLRRLDLESAPFFVALGHLEPRKGLELALAALARASGAAAAARLVVVGGAGDRDGAGAAAVRESALRHRVDARLVLAGARSDAEVATLLRHAAALLFPSRHEGFGFPVFEALEIGCPVVARPLPCLAALPDVAAERAHSAATAALVRCDDDPVAWAAALAPLAAHARPPTGRRSFAPARPWRHHDVARELAAVWRAIER